MPPARCRASKIDLSAERLSRFEGRPAETIKAFADDSDSVKFAMSRPPEETMNVYVVGKQWMWKFQHLDGEREINELHVPVGRAVKLIMTSEDVIHDVFVPAFRVKADVLPGRYTNIWFQPTKPGRYHLFCAEYCGTRHSGMKR